jgi:hypothetical protein
MFRPALVAASLFAVSLVAACDDTRSTEPAALIVVEKPAAPASDPTLQTLHGTLRAVMLMPADSADSTAAPTLVWDLVISADNIVRLSGDIIGPVPALDGMDVFVTGHLADGALKVESYIVNQQPAPAEYTRLP